MKSLILNSLLVLIATTAFAAHAVTPPPARKAPTPPSGPTPHMPDGAVDLSGVWVLSGSPNLPVIRPTRRKRKNSTKPERPTKARTTLLRFVCQTD